MRGIKPSWNKTEPTRRARKAGKAAAKKRPVPVILPGTKFRNPKQEAHPK